MAKLVSKPEVCKDSGKSPEKPKKLSKAGEWRRANPKGIREIIDMRAVLR